MQPLQIYTPSAKSPQAGGGKYRRPRNVWVVLAAGPVTSIRSKNILAKKLIAENVDARYNGPRSDYGIAMQKAERISASMEKFLEAIDATGTQRDELIAKYVVLRITGEA